MKWSFRIFSFAGTEVRIHVTLFLLLLFVASQGFMVRAALMKLRA